MPPKDASTSIAKMEIDLGSTLIFNFNLCRLERVRPDVMESEP